MCVKNPARVQMPQNVSDFHDGRALNFETDLKGDKKKNFEMMSIVLRTVRTWSTDIFNISLDGSAYTDFVKRAFNSFYIKSTKKIRSEMNTLKQGKMKLS